MSLFYWLIFYISGYLSMFYIYWVTRKDDAKYLHDFYGMKMSNGFWLLKSLFLSIFSWALLIPTLLYNFIVYLYNKLYNNADWFKKIINWLKSPINYA